MKEFYMNGNVLPNLFCEYQDDIKRADYKVFFGLMKHMGYGGKVLIPQHQIAEEWKISPSQVSKAIKKFKELQLLSVNRNSYGQRYIQMNDTFAKKGSVKKSKNTTKLKVIQGKKA